MENSNKQNVVKPPAKSPYHLPGASVVAGLSAFRVAPRVVAVAVTLDPASVFDALDLKPRSTAETLVALQDAQTRISDVEGSTTERAAAQAEYLRHLIVLLLNNAKILQQ